MRGSRAAGMILAGLPVEGQGAAGSEEIIDRYASAGIAAFLFPGLALLDPERLGSLAAKARQACSAAGLGRPLIAIGGSPGPGFGLPPWPRGPSPLGIAALGSRQAAKRAGRLLGLELAACGVDLVLAPRLDLATDPKDSAGVLDGFGQDPRLASALGAAFVRGLGSAGVAACAGRFPGLGSTCAECFDGLSFVSLPAERLEAVEMRPFAAAVRGGIDAILVGRAFVPAFEPERIPAARSARVIEGRLRAQLGFRGLVIGDGLGGEKARDNAVLLGALAGCDLCLVADPDEALSAASALAAALASGEMPEPRLHVATRRLGRFLSHWPSRPESGARPPHGRLGLRVERDRSEALAVLRGGPFEALPAEGLLVAVFVPPAGSPDAAETEAALEALGSAFPGAQILALPNDPDFGKADSVAALLSEKGFRAAAILTCDAHLHPAQESLARLIEDAVPRSIVVAMRDPYDAAFFPRAEALVAAFGFSAGGAAAVARLLSGRAQAAGRSPVEVIGIEL
ncbi:MAG TPA: glycoside hydrolase family 3 N-terminal domain-containing protein [Rectinemataceae bacterium]|nr:glycoside hydrolase family 3 N-terminal domain-containing protein [Rectinemataceae bacterium]